MGQKEQGLQLEAGERGCGGPAHRTLAGEVRPLAFTPPAMAFWEDFCLKE